MKTKWIFTRSFDAGNYLENFLVSAVTAVLGIRLFLQMTGYPQIGGSTLHIAHMLWGGLLMLISIIILITFLNRAPERLASILGGIGFGTFIDEVGKFITRDNNYFFQPSIAIIYIIFILIFITIRAIQSGRGYSQNEYLINALRETQELVLHDLDEEGKNRALYYLNQGNPKNPLVIALANMLSNIKLTPYLSPSFYTRIKINLKNLYRRITLHRTFYIGIITFFIFQMIVTLAYAIVLIFFLGLGWEKILSIRVLNHIVQRIYNLSFIEWAELFSSLLSGVFVTIGVFSINRSRIFAIRMFERSILVTIFLTEVFIFYREQFAALLGLSLNILILIALRFMIEQEEAEVVKSTK